MVDSEEIQEHWEVEMHVNKRKAKLYVFLGIGIQANFKSSEIGSNSISRNILTASHKIASGRIPELSKKSNFTWKFTFPLAKEDIDVREEISRFLEQQFLQYKIPALMANVGFEERYAHLKSNIHPLFSTIV